MAISNGRCLGLGDHRDLDNDDPYACLGVHQDRSLLD